MYLNPWERATNWYPGSGPFWKTRSRSGDGSLSTIKRQSSTVSQNNESMPEEREICYSIFKIRKLSSCFDGQERNRCWKWVGHTFGTTFTAEANRKKRNPSQKKGRQKENAESKWTISTTTSWRHWRCARRAMTFWPFPFSCHSPPWPCDAVVALTGRREHEINKKKGKREKLACVLRAWVGGLYRSLWLAKKGPKGVVGYETTPHSQNKVTWRNSRNNNKCPSESTAADGKNQAKIVMVIVTCRVLSTVTDTPIHADRQQGDSRKENNAIRPLPRETITTYQSERK